MRFVAESRLVGLSFGLSLGTAKSPASGVTDPGYSGGYATIASCPVAMAFATVLASVSIE
jgi:hypothetical protein